MQHLWSILCQQAIVNQETQTVSLIEIVERIQFGRLPAVEIELSSIDALPVAVTLVTLWQRSDPEQTETGRGRVQIKSPSGKIIGNPQPLEYDINLADAARFRAIARFMNLPFAGSGTYQIATQLMENDDWHDIASVSVEIVADLG